MSFMSFDDQLKQQRKLQEIPSANPDEFGFVQEVPAAGSVGLSESLGQSRRAIADFSRGERTFSAIPQYSAYPQGSSGTDYYGRNNLNFPGTNFLMLYRPSVNNPGGQSHEVWDWETQNWRSPTIQEQGQLTSKLYQPTSEPFVDPKKYPGGFNPESPQGLVGGRR